MKNHLSLSIAVAVLIATLLACNVPQGPVDKTIQIDSVTVQPPSGSSSFVLEVSFTVSRGQLVVMIDSIHCYYVTPDGASMNIGQYSPPEPMPGEEPYHLSNTMNFNVTQANGVIQPGVNQASCTTSQDPATVITTTFTVTGEATPTPTSTPTLTSTTVTATTLKGHIVYEYNDQISMDLYPWIESICNPEKGPEITITPDGELSNTTCQEGENPEVRQTNSATYTYQVTGMVDASGNVEFTAEVWFYGKSSQGETEDVRHIIITGQGQFGTPTQAEGTASFTYTCDDDSSWAQNQDLCGDGDHLNSSGEIPWSFVPAP